jgi:DNA-binding NtrC family response regulator
MSGHILIVDDDRDMCEMLDGDLRRRGYATAWAVAADEALQKLQGGDFDLVLTDLNMPGMSGVELCRHIAGNRPDIPVIVLTAFGSLDTAVSAIRAGAYDFVEKPVDLDLLVIVLERALKHRALQEQIRILKQGGAQDIAGGQLIGESPPMQELKQQIARIAGTDASVLIVGESGTGKELVAHVLHQRSPRQQKPFVALNCAALPDTLLESELFGYRRGAFTDAKTDRKGLLQEAEGGTIFLDEIGEMSTVLQPKLLRALEERRLRPVGGSTEIEFDVRIIAATNRDLEEDVASGRFRSDLYYRLNVIQLQVPPLRTRGTDMLLLAQHFLAQFTERFGKQMSSLSDGAARRLLDYSWPGNVRELRNAMERAVALAQYDRVVVEDLPEKIQAQKAANILQTGDDPADLLPLAEVERRYILHVLKVVGGNRSIAARILGCDRKTLYRKLRSYGVQGD